jgi:hypothetical protein
MAYIFILEQLRGFMQMDFEWVLTTDHPLRTNEFESVPTWFKLVASAPSAFLSFIFKINYFMQIASKRIENKRNV